MLLIDNPVLIADVAIHHKIIDLVGLMWVDTEHMASITMVDTMQPGSGAVYHIIGIMVFGHHGSDFGGYTRGGMIFIIAETTTI